MQYELHGSHMLVVFLNLCGYFIWVAFSFEHMHDRYCYIYKSDEWTTHINVNELKFPFLFPFFFSRTLLNTMFWTQEKTQEMHEVGRKEEFNERNNCNEMEEMTMEQWITTTYKFWAIDTCH